MREPSPCQSHWSLCTHLAARPMSLAGFAGHTRRAEPLGLGRVEAENLPFCRSSSHPPLSRRVLSAHKRWVK